MRNPRATFEEEGLILDLSLKRRSLRKYKDYSWAFKKRRKNGHFWVPISKAIFQKLKLASKYLRAGNGRWIFSETEPVLTWRIIERQPQFLAVLKLLVAQNLTIGWAGPTTPNYNKLNKEISKANSWFKLNGMQPNIKKTKHLLIGTAKKLYHSEITTLELFIDNAKECFCK